MKSAKERKMDKKRKAKEVSTRKSDASRKRRLDNKVKREAIHKINPDLKVTIVNGVTYTDDGINGKVAVEVINGKIKATKLDSDFICEYVDEDPVEPIIKVSTVKEIVEREGIISKIETKNKSAIQRLTDKLRGI